MFGKQRNEPSAPDSHRIQPLDSEIIVQQALYYSFYYNSLTGSSIVHDVLFLVAVTGNFGKRKQFYLTVKAVLQTVGYLERIH